MLIGLVAEGEGGGEGERESHSKVGTLLGPTMIYCLQKLVYITIVKNLKVSKFD